MTQIDTDRDSLLGNLDPTGQTVVDVGCGAGAMVRWLKSIGAEATGVECGVEALDAAQAADPGHEESYVEGEGQNLPLDDGIGDQQLCGSLSVS
jgi:ubiquinone/menaquinone biosynthesis C-methylase UbiE